LVDNLTSVEEISCELPSPLLIDSEPSSACLQWRTVGPLSYIRKRSRGVFLHSLHQATIHLMLHCLIPGLVGHAARGSVYLSTIRASYSIADVVCIDRFQEVKTVKSGKNFHWILKKNCSFWKTLIVSLIFLPFVCLN